MSLVCTHGAWQRRSRSCGWLKVTPFNLSNSSMDGVCSGLQMQLFRRQNWQAEGGAFDYLFEQTFSSTLPHYFWNVFLQGRSCAWSRQVLIGWYPVLEWPNKEQTHIHCPHLALLYISGGHPPCPFPGGFAGSPCPVTTSTHKAKPIYFQTSLYFWQLLHSKYYHFSLFFNFLPLFLPCDRRVGIDP